MTNGWSILGRGALSLLVLMAPVSTAWAVDALDDPMILHAEATLAELDGDIPRAIELLRRAYDLDPKDELIMFDLARMALEHTGQGAGEALTRFLAVEPTTTDGRLLQAYINLQRGDKHAAARQVDIVLKNEPNNEEALKLAAQITPSAVKKAPKKKKQPEGGKNRVALRVSSSGQYDSNVTVDPDVRAKEEGYRLMVDAALLTTIGWSRGTFDFGVFFQYGRHMNNRSVLATYDVGSAIAFFGMQYRTKYIDWYGEVAGTGVFVDSFNQPFMEDGGFTLEGLVAGLPVRLGLYTSWGYRNFRFQNVEGRNDRNGARGEVGFKFAYSHKIFRASLKGGYQQEFSQGTDQREWGARAKAKVGLELRPFVIALSSGYEHRIYNSHSADRLDKRLTPSLKVSYMLGGFFRAFVGYNWTRNYSIPNFDYERHVGQIGIEGIL